MIEGIVIAVIACVAAFIRGSFYKNKSEKLQNENKHLEKENTIEKGMDKASRQAEKEEFDALSNVDPKDWRDKI